MTRLPLHAFQFANQWAELAIATPQVVAHRLTRMALAGPVPSPRDRREFSRMVREKNTAFSASWQAMAQHGLQAQQAALLSMYRSCMAPWSWGSHATAASATTTAALLPAATLAMLSKGLAPVHRKAVANARRLVHTRLR